LDWTKKVSIDNKIGLPHGVEKKKSFHTSRERRGGEEFHKDHRSSLSPPPKFARRKGGKGPKFVSARRTPGPPRFQRKGGGKKAEKAGPEVGKGQKHYTREKKEGTRNEEGWKKNAAGKIASDERKPSLSALYPDCGQKKRGDTQGREAGWGRKSK